jgi:hypothetical protein
MGALPWGRCDGGAALGALRGTRFHKNACLPLRFGKSVCFGLWRIVERALRDERLDGGAWMRGRLAGHVIWARVGNGGT